MKAKRPLLPTDFTRVNHETGAVHVPGKGELPLIGPTTGAAYQDLKEKEVAHKRSMLALKRAILSTYQCTQCKKKQSGANLRIKVLNVGGVLTETLVCSDQTCDAPVTLIEDVKDVRRIPGAQ